MEQLDREQAVSEVSESANSEKDLQNEQSEKDEFFEQGSPPPPEFNFGGKCWFYFICQYGSLLTDVTEVVKAKTEKYKQKKKSRNKAKGVIKYEQEQSKIYKAQA